MKEKIFEFIKNYITENKYAPTVREICKGVGLKSTGNVYKYLHLLKRAGRIDFVEGTARTITIKAG